MPGCTFAPDARTYFKMVGLMVQCRMASERRRQQVDPLEVGTVTRDGQGFSLLAPPPPPDHGDGGRQDFAAQGRLSQPPPAPRIEFKKTETAERLGGSAQRKQPEGESSVGVNGLTSSI